MKQRKATNAMRPITPTTIPAMAPPDSFPASTGGGTGVFVEVDGEVGMDVMGEVLSGEDVLLVLAEDSVGVGSVDEGVDDISSPFMLTRYDKDTFCPWYRGPHGGQDHPLRSPQWSSENREMQCMLPSESHRYCFPFGRCILVHFRSLVPLSIWVSPRSSVHHQVQPCERLGRKAIIMKASQIDGRCFVREGILSATTGWVERAVTHSILSLWFDISKQLSVQMRT